jgi:dienelactone hydrolase
VLLAGSGPQDRDETVGPNKPLKDLAWGLASLGIAVARFDKITLTHPEHLATGARVTILEEYAPQALAAIGMIAAQPGVDPRRVSLIGHSLGGTVAPRIAAAQPGLAGLVLLAAGAQPLHLLSAVPVRDARAVVLRDGLV